MIRRTMTRLSCLAGILAARRASVVVAFVARHGTVTEGPFQCRLGTLVQHRGYASALQPLGAAIAPTNDSSSSKSKTVPITLLSGFLGSGKTTTLQHLLENKDGLRIGVIVNDMASVNIDAKLVKQTDSDSSGGSGSSSRLGNDLNSNDVVELQNGCACCSLADELLTTVETLLATKQTKSSASSSSDSNDDDAFDAVVVELSGVGDPIAIKQNWKTAQAMGHPVTKHADMKRVVTLIDSSTFGTDWMTWDIAGERDGWVDTIDDCAGGRKVPELLAEQIESADVLLLNKVDLAGPEQVQVAGALARSINEKAVVEEVAFGKVASPKLIIRDDLLAAATAKEPPEKKQGSCCSSPDCGSRSKPSESTETGSAEAVAAAVADDDASKCTDADCGDPECSEHGENAARASATSDDDGHDHDHSHSHSHHTSIGDLGIVNFVYKADRAFDTRTLMGLLNTWPIPIKEDLEGLEHFSSEAAKDDEEDVGRESPFFGVLRSKGFCWLEPTAWDPEEGDVWRHDTAFYWSHAGKHFGITTAGKWWDTLEEAKMKKYFREDPEEYERIRSEDFVTEQWGDRRQEIVFIGANIDEERIKAALDDCLLGDKGMEVYSQRLNNYLLNTKPVSGWPRDPFDV